MVGYYDYGLGEWVEDEYSRKKIMKRKGLQEAGSLEEIERYTKRKEELGEDDFRQMIVDSIERYKYDKYTQWRLKQQEKIGRWNQMIESYNKGQYTFYNLAR